MAMAASRIGAVEENTKTWTLTATRLMVVDFAKFLKLGRVCLVDSDRGSPWSALALRAIVSSRTAFVAVKPTPRKTAQGVTSPTNASLISYRSYRERCLDGLLVTHIDTEGKVGSWAQVTIATYQSGERAISFWQVYQVTPKHKQHLLPSGLWTLRSRKPEGKETGGSKTDASEPVERELRTDSETNSREEVSIKESRRESDSIMESRMVLDSIKESKRGSDSGKRLLTKDSQGHTIEDSSRNSKEASEKESKKPALSTAGENAVTRWEKTKSEILQSKGEETVSREMLHGRLEMVEGDPLLRRQDLSGFHLRCTTLSAPPRMILQSRAGGEAVDVEGILGHVFRHLQEVTNFTSTCLPTSDGQWGGQENGRWTGMVGDIVNGEADIAVASLDVTFQRSTAVDFLLPVLHTEYKMIMKRPTNDDRVWSAYTEEFEGEVWQVLLVLTPLLILSLYFASVLVPVEESMTLAEAFTTVTGALCGQSTDIELRMMPSRLVFLTILQLQVLLQAYYTCVLVSSLALGPPLPDIESISDVQRHPSLQLGFVRGSSITEYFKNSANLEYQSVWHSTVEHSLPESRQEAMTRVLEDSYVFLDAISYLRDNHGQDCRLVIMPQAYFPSQSAFAVRKGAPFVALFNSIILKMRSSGLLKRWQSLFVPILPDCSQAESEAIQLATVATPFLMLGTAILISLLCLLSERAIWRRWSGEVGK
ncbi:probable glutamate receptor [Penaeus chinensis]|uniref:probable glutamate receptor n=1 Tax=Penaeus chinensis TaxID=139456 RepID=UPI001FB6586F|nr:probable glutamate receptor [Penaeus chinensis]